MKIKRNEMSKKVIAALMCIGMCVPFCASAVTYEDLENIKETSHEIADKARSIGLPEDHVIILQSKELWDGANEAIQNQEYEQPTQVTYYSNEDVLYLAKVAYCEARGIKSKMEIACIMWTVLNRVDTYGSSIRSVVTAPNQFAFYSSAPTISDYGYDLKELARDVLNRWNQEKNGYLDIGRVLPSDYLWYSGDGRHNYFRNKFKTRNHWNYSLQSPYEN